MASIIIQQTNPNAFYYALGLARRTLKHGDSLSTADSFVCALAQLFQKYKERFPNTPHDTIQRMFYKDYAKLYLVKDGNELTGMFAIIDGEIQALASFGVSGKWLVSKALEEGGKRLDCFAGYLPGFYAQYGFIEYKREKNWEAGGPDVVYMVQRP